MDWSKVGIPSGILAVALMLTTGVNHAAAQEVSGTRVAWHPITVDFLGPKFSELDDAPNPFLDFRLIVKFTSPSGDVQFVPGFFDGDGQGGGTGDVWRCRFSPSNGGKWKFQAMFVTGEQIAIDPNMANGTPTSFNGAKGEFTVAGVDPRAQGFYRYGLLEYIGEPYLKFRNGPYYIKGGTDSPENFLGYRGFDNTWDQNGGAGTSGLPDGVHRYPDHVKDWGKTGLGDEDDPFWISEDTGYDSRGIIGALNYLSRVKVNSVYFLPMNMGGDGRETVPFVGFEKTGFDKTHYDISKLHQWSMVMEQATRRGILLHFVLAETESGNENWLDNGSLGRERKLFYREMISRFGHNLALKWNLSEENDYSTAEIKEFASYIRKIDPWNHPIAFHTHLMGSNSDYPKYNNVLGFENLEMSSLQCHPEDAGKHVEYWREKTKKSGQQWVIDVDELSPAGTGLTDWNAEELRKTTLWDVYLSGGNIEWYAGYHTLPLGGDMRMENFRTRQEMWIYMRHARDFMQRHVPFWDAEPMDHLLTGESNAYGGGEVMGLPGDTYAVYLPSASPSGKLDLSDDQGTMTMRWYSPRSGSFLGEAQEVNGGKLLSLGVPPDDGSGGKATVFQEKDGLLVMEVESAKKVGAWAEETKFEGFTGKSYYRWDGPNNFNKPGEGVIEYQFEITNPGEYQLRMHNRHNHPEPDQENDCWIRLDGGTWYKMYSNKGNQTVNKWNWHSQFEHNGKHEKAHYELTAGVHTIEVSGRSHNYMADRLHLYLPSVSNPEDKSHPESKKGSSSGGSASEDWVVLIKKN